MSRVRFRLSYANVTATIALFLALGGGAIAAPHLGKNSVTTKSIKKNAVTAVKIKKGAVTNPKIADGAVTAGKLAAGAVPVPTGYINIGPGGVVRGSQGVNGITRVAGGQVYCLDANFTVNSIVGSRSVDSGGGVSIEVGTGAQAGLLGCPAPFNDAVWQNVASANPGNNDGYFIWIA
jgi:hypothetical protein